MEGKKETKITEQVYTNDSEQKNSNSVTGGFPLFNLTDLIIIFDSRWTLDFL